MNEDMTYLVTQIVEINKKKRRVYINYESAFALYIGEMRRFKIKEDMPVSQEVYEEIVYQILPKRAKIRAMNLLKANDLTQHALEKKLKDGYYPKTAIETAIAYVKGYGYIDDRRYVVNYVNFKSSSKSRYQITNFLQQKGVDRELIVEVCDEYYEDCKDSEKQLIKKLVLKRNVDVTSMTREERAKLMGYLMRKGFRIDAINGVIDEIVDELREL